MDPPESTDDVENDVNKNDPVPTTSNDSGPNQETEDPPREAIIVRSSFRDFHAAAKKLIQSKSRASVEPEAAVEGASTEEEEGSQDPSAKEQIESTSKGAVDWIPDEEAEGELEALPGPTEFEDLSPKDLIRLRNERMELEISALADKLAAEGVLYKEMLDSALTDSLSYYQTNPKDYLMTNLAFWYRVLKRYTIRTKFIKISEGFLKYLKSESSHLPEGVETSATSSVQKGKKDDMLGFGFGDDDDGDDSWQQIDDDGGIDFSDAALDSAGYPILPPGEELAGEMHGPAPSIEMMTITKMTSGLPFGRLNEGINEIIKELGGKVFPKLNWKAPTDAAWAGYNKSLCCYMPGDIYLLLQCSSRISEMLEEFPDGAHGERDMSELPPGTIPRHPHGYYLGLRKWKDISPDTEFRCFVMKHRLVGITQRDVSCFYPEILKHRDDIIFDIYIFYTKIHKVLHLPFYIFDVIRTKKKVKLVDMNAFSKEIDSCLFTYRELGKLYVEMNANAKVKRTLYKASKLLTAVKKLEDLENENENKASKEPKPKKEEKGKKGKKSFEDRLPWTDHYGEPYFRFLGTAAPNPFLNTGAKHAERMRLSQGDK